MLAYIYRPFPTPTFLLFYLITCLGALLVDELMRRRSVLLSSILGFGCGVGLLLFSQYFDSAWWRFSNPKILDTYHYGGEWFNYVIALPDVIKWYLAPGYVASLVVRLNRRLKRKRGTT